MQAPAINLHSQYFFQAHIAEVDFTAKMVHQSKLAGLVGRFKHYLFEAERCGKTICGPCVKISGLVKQTHATSALSRFHNKLEGPVVKPSLALFNQFIDIVFCKRAGVLFPQFELNIETP